MRCSPEDFVVDEVPLYPPSGEGGHTFVRIEKRLRNTEEVARGLARAAGVSPRDVGYAGRKDRVAVTRQWFSVPGLDPAQALELELPGVRVLQAEPHAHKLRTGQLAANRFELVIRNLEAAGIDRAREAAAEIVTRGFENRFGPQRFGRDADNARRARAFVAGDKRVARDRREARFLLSALQAEVFNRVLAERPLAFDALESGDVAVVHQSGGLFDVEDPEIDNQRAAQREICASGPIFGTRMRRASGEPGRREEEVALAMGVPDLQPPAGIRMRGTRRPLRALASGLALEETEPGVVRLTFSLTPGCYATVLLEALFGSLPSDGSRTSGGEVPSPVRADDSAGSETVS